MPAKEHVIHGRDHRSRGLDPIPAKPWVDPTLTSPWVDADPANPFMYRWGPFGDTVDEAGLEFTGHVTGGASGSAVMTFPAADRFDSDREFDVAMRDGSGQPMVGRAFIESTTGVLTIAFPVAPAGGGLTGIEASENGVDVTMAPRGRFNFVAGTSIKIDVIDDPTNGQATIVIGLVTQNTYGAIKASNPTYTAVKTAYATYAAMLSGLA